MCDGLNDYGIVRELLSGGLAAELTHSLAQLSDHQAHIGKIDDEAHDIHELIGGQVVALFFARSPGRGFLSQGQVYPGNAKCSWSHASLSPGFRESGPLESWTRILTPQAFLPFVAFAARSASSALAKSTKRYLWFQAPGSPNAGVRGMTTLLTASLPVFSVGQRDYQRGGQYAHSVSIEKIADIDVDRVVVWHVRQSSDE